MSDEDNGGNPVESRVGQDHVTRRCLAVLAVPTGSL